MKAAVLFGMPVNAVPGYCWQWRSVDHTTKSIERFIYYYECLTDARPKGYDPQIQKAVFNERAPHYH
jgi:hypothetical protein